MLAAEKPDAVVIAVPPLVTAAIAAPVISAGVPVLLEKPPGLTGAELDRLIAAARAGSTPVQVAFNRRFMPVLRKARDLIVRHFTPAEMAIEYAMIRSNRWNEDFSTTAIHALDALVFLAGAPIELARFEYRLREDQGRSATDVVMVGQTTSGVRLRLTIHPVAGQNAEFIRINSTGRSLVVNVPASPIAADEGRLEFWSDGSLTETHSDRDAEMIERMGIVGELDAFLQNIRAGKPVSPRLSECRQQVTLMEAMRVRRDVVPFV